MRKVERVESPHILAPHNQVLTRRKKQQGQILSEQDQSRVVPPKATGQRRLQRHKEKEVSRKSEPSTCKTHSST